MFSITAKGSHEQIGYQMGYKFAEQIKSNITICNQGINYKALEKGQVTSYVELYTKN